MFKSWSKKNKIKAVFQLQFYATEVPKLKKPAVMISLVPEDVGKPTVKLQKVPVQDGTCTWENPVYESMKLTREPKTGKINEKLYHFIVSTGSSKSGYLGEAAIDFSDFAAVTEPLTVSLPLKFANSGAILHVTIQRVQGADDQRDLEENGAPGLLSDRSSENQESIWNIDEENLNRTEDGNLAGYTFKNDEYGAYDKTTTARQDASSFLSHFRPSTTSHKGTVDAPVTNNYMLHRSNTDLSADSVSDGSLVDSPSSIENSRPRQRLQDASDDSTDKNEITMLRRQVELSELELQSLRKQIAKETKQGQSLTRQIISLEDERDAFKSQCEQLKSLQTRIDEAEAPKRLQPEIEDKRSQLESMRQEINHEKKLNGNLQLQLQKTQDSNSELILVVKDLEDMLEKRNKEISDLSSKLKSAKLEVENKQSFENLAKKRNDAKEINLLELKIRDLYGEIDIYEKEKEEQNMHIEQLTLNNDLLKQDNYDMSMKLKQNQEERKKMENECSGYKAAIKELETQIKRLEGTIEKQALQFSESLRDIDELESQVKDLEKRLAKQAKAFQDDLDAMARAKAEQEKKAIQAEEALQNTKLNNAIRAEHLQDDFRRLSLEMATKVDVNEKQAAEALREANDLRLQNKILEDKLQKATREIELIKDQEKVKLQELVNKMDLKAKQIEQTSLELNEKSQQGEQAQKQEEEKHEAFLTEIQMLRAEIERLNKKKSSSLEQEDEKEKLRNEMKKLKTLIREKEMMVQKLSKQKVDLEKKVSLAKKEAEKELKISSLRAKDQHNHSDLLTEVASLKDKNKSMEKELKEMEERYSEISLRFAEVEGERQQLVMTVRNLKNGKKN
ncbi:hypothetical protein FEM48_Zijuj03G0153800 [Ziziphus jujuba var. spinosa]|uniref:C2 NT-type domain-containing protein n=1 Tax=Ziziphus jujuba var. spinosa TaxID=714518 RepID=A0A978VR33_ZIZJJ|nr:hypothetical protein FEM48_Zijuj03G0153800 [Ziziphus jujuba var. spinosa]